MSPQSSFTNLIVAGLAWPGLAAAQTLPAWMAGSWCLSRNGEQIEEVWLAPAGGLMLGMGRTTAGSGQRTHFEFMRIELRDGTTTYLAQPQGRLATAFKLIEADSSSARFENPAHDFPKRIEYRRDGNAMRAEIAGPGRDGKERVIGFDFVVCPGEGARR